MKNVSQTAMILGLILTANAHAMIGGSTAATDSDRPGTSAAKFLSASTNEVKHQPSVYLGLPDSQERVAYMEQLAQDVLDRAGLDIGEIAEFRRKNRESFGAITKEKAKFFGLMRSSQASDPTALRKHLDADIAQLEAMKTSGEANIRTVITASMAAQAKMNSPEMQKKWAANQKAVLSEQDPVKQQALIKSQMAEWDNKPGRLPMALVQLIGGW